MIVDLKSASKFSCSEVDFNGDGEVEIEDLGLLKVSWCSEYGEEAYSDRVDINNDGKIDHYELGFFKCCFLKDATQSVDLGNCIETVDESLRCEE